MKSKSKKTCKKQLTDRQIITMTVKAGALSAKIIDPATVVTGEWVRWKCRFGCGGYGSSLVCPPHTPTPAETQLMLDGYDRAVLFESPGGKVKEIAASLERTLFLKGYYKALGLGAGPCSLCHACAFEEGCRYPYKARPSMEACGIDVYATVRAHDYTINVVTCAEDPQHYFGLVLVA
jgi:predicted metal-binding protein